MIQLLFKSPREQVVPMNGISLTFDFSMPDSGTFNPDSISYDRIYVYFDKGEKKRNESFYWDQLELVETAKLISFQEASASKSSTAKEESP